MNRRAFLAAALASTLGGCSSLETLNDNRIQVSSNSIDNRPTTGPVSAEETVVVASYETLYGVSKDFSSVCWRRQFPEKISGRPAVIDDRVFVTVATVRSDRQNWSKLYALDANTGETVWKINLNAEDIYPPVRDPQDRSTVLVRNRTALHGISTDGRKQWTIDDLPEQTVVVPSSKETCSPGGDDEFLYVLSANAVLAIDRNTQEEVWRVDAHEPQNPPASDGERVYVPAGAKGLVTVKRNTGEKCWAFGEETPESLPNSVGSYAKPIVGDSRVFVDLSGNHTAVKKDGSIDWVTDLRTTSPSNPVSFGGANYMAGADLVTVNRATGSKRVLVDDFPTALSLSVDNGVLYASGTDSLYRCKLP